MDAAHLTPGAREDQPLTDCLLIVVSYRSAQAVAALLATVSAAVGDLSWQAVVVNNDHTEDLRQIVGACPQATVVEAGGNVGYAGGINRGLADAPTARWTVFLNPDLRLGPNSIARMAAASGERDAVVPTIVDDAGALQHSLRREPTVMGSLGDALFGDRWPDRPARLSEMVTHPAVYESPGSIDWATGAALLVPSAVVKRVGSWDEERFFLYSEETDYFRRLRAAGCVIRFEPAALVTHRGGGSGTSDALYALQEVNRVRYIRKWHSAGTTVSFAGVVTMKNLLRCHRKRSRVALRALLWPPARRALPGGS